MTMLDRSRPFGEVWGAGGQFCYEQDGRQFRLDGTPREAERQPEPGSEPEPMPVIRLDPREETRVAAEPPAKGKAAAKAKAGAKAAAPAPAAAAAPDLVKLPDDDLKAMVEIAGGVWTTRTAALAFLAADKE